MELLPSASAPIPPKKGSVLLTVILILSLSSNVVLGYQNQLFKQQIRQMIQARRPAPLGFPTPSPSPLTQTVTASESGVLFYTYVDSAKKFSLQYPNDWSLTYDNTGKIKITQLKKLGWEIKLETSLEFIKDQCGGSGPVSGTSKNLYQNLTVLGRSASRTTLEKGNYWAGGGQGEPFPQPILFRRLADELATGWPAPDTDNSYVYKFCYENTDKGFSLKITYLSDQFTLDKIQTMSLDKTMLAEMDKIITSLKLE